MSWFDENRLLEPLVPSAPIYRNPGTPIGAGAPINYADPDPAGRYHPTGFVSSDPTPPVDPPPYTNPGTPVGPGVPLPPGSPAPPNGSTGAPFPTRPGAPPYQPNQGAGYDAWYQATYGANANPNLAGNTPFQNNVTVAAGTTPPYAGGWQPGQPIPVAAGPTGATGAPGATTTSGPPTLNRNDPASVDAFIAYYAKQPGANPSLTNDPGYWRGKISSGEFGDDQNYIIGKFMTPEGAPAGSRGGNQAPYGPNPSGIDGPFGATPFQFDPSKSTFNAQPFNFTYRPNDPSYQFVRDEALGAVARSGAARGIINTGGIAKALQDRGAQLASTEYGNEFTRQYQTAGLNFNQGLAANQNAFGQQYQTSGLNFNQGLAANQNFFGQNYNLANLGLSATSYK